MTATLSTAYQAKPADYFVHARREIEPLLTRKFLRCIEVGCGAGHTGAWLKQAGHCDSVVGIELFPSAAAEASDVLDDAICADVEALDVSTLSSCDLLLCLDVLEHLRDPWSVLKRLTSRLADNGLLITSIPNLQHFSVSFPLLFGRFAYTDDGLLDRTHLRFFTKRAAIQLVESAGLTPERVINSFPRRWLPLDYLSLSLLRGLLTRQYIISATRS